MTVPHGIIGKGYNVQMNSRRYKRGEPALWQAASEIIADVRINPSVNLHICTLAFGLWLNSVKFVLLSLRLNYLP